MDLDQLKNAAKIIKDDGIVAFPTETVYGIGGNAFSECSLEKIFAVKERNYNKPISVLVSNLGMIEQVACVISHEEYKIIKKFMPGPLTLILKKKQNISNKLTSNMSAIGVRIPQNDIALKLIEYSGVPLATSSANISGQESNIRMEEIKEIFGDKIDYYIDGGETKIGIASTVVQIIDGKVKILREGSITKKEIEDVINNKE